MATLFRDLAIGRGFNWIDPNAGTFNSFYLDCVKLSTRTYRDERGAVHRVGTINAKVFNVKKEGNN